MPPSNGQGVGDAIPFFEEGPPSVVMVGLFLFYCSVNRKGNEYEKAIDFVMYLVVMYLRLRDARHT